MPKPHQLILLSVIWTALAGIVIMILSQLIGRWFWPLELVSHYVPHLALLTLVAAIILSASRLLNRRLRYYRIAFFVTAAALLYWCVTPLSLVSAIPATLMTQKNNERKPITLAYQNVNIANKTPNQTLSQLTQHHPDVLILIEAGGPNWQAPIEALAPRYLVGCGVVESSPFAMQILIAKPMIKDHDRAQCEMMQLAGYPMARITIAHDQIIYAVHPPPPINQVLAENRSKYLNALATLIDKDPSDSLLVVGDFNLSGFSPLYRDFIDRSGQNHHKLERTTLAGLPTWLPFGLGIDQILIRGHQDAITTQPMSWQGSDHRGFIIQW